MEYLSINQSGPRYWLPYEQFSTQPYTSMEDATPNLIYEAIRVKKTNYRLTIDSTQPNVS